MIRQKDKIKPKNLYKFIINNKLISICVLFTFFTLLDTIPILFGYWPGKTNLDPYIHLLGRFVLHSILVFGLYFYDIIVKVVKSKIIVYFTVYFLTLGILLSYIWINSLFVGLHPDAYIDASISYTFMYFVLGIILVSKKFIRSK